MVGLAVFAIMGLYGIVSLILLVKVPMQAKTWPVRIILFMFILALVSAFPVGDPILSRMAFDKYCAEHSAPIIHRAVGNVDRVALECGAKSLSVKTEDTPGGGYLAGPLIFHLDRYAYVEDICGKVLEYSPPFRPLPNGQHIKKSLSKYKITEERVAYNRRFRAYEYKVIDSDNSVMASMQVVTWHGGGFNGPIFHFMTGSYGTGKEIYPDTREVVEFIYSVLSPK